MKLSFFFKFKFENFQKYNNIHLTNCNFQPTHLLQLFYVILVLFREYYSLFLRIKDTIYFFDDQKTTKISNPEKFSLMGKEDER